MTEFLVRAVEQPLACVGDGRTVVGKLAPYNEPALVNDGWGPYYEMFLPGCFDRCISGAARYLKVQLMHNGHWVGRGDEWDNRPDGLWADLRLDDTEAGREAAFKVRDGQAPGLSLEFLPSSARQFNIRGKHNGLDLVKRSRVKALRHVALCDFPAYESAQVAVVRSAPLPEGPPERLAYWQDWTARVRRT